MARDVLTLCQEYLGSSSPATRGRAVVALAAEGGASSAPELARLALDEADAGVRERAIEAIAGLDGTPRALAMDALDRALVDPERRVVAHDLLAWLRNRGVPIPAGKRSFWASLGLAFAVRRASARAGLRTFETAIYPWCLGFAVLGAVLTIFLITIKTALEGVAWLLLATVFAAAIATSPWLARAVCAGARRGDSYLDRVPGWVVEIVAAGLDGFPPIAVLGVLMLGLWPSPAGLSALTVVGLGLGILIGGFVFTAAIRLATLSCSVRVPRSWVGTLLGAGAGWGAGITAATASFLLVRWGVSRGTAEPEVTALAAGLWLFALPVAAGVGAAFARLERDAVVPQDKRWRFWLGLPSILAGLLLVAGWEWFFWERVPIETIAVPAQGAPPERKPCDRVPMRQKITVAGGEHKLSARAVPKSASTRLALRLWDQSQNAFLKQSQPEAPAIEAPLAPGDYLLEVIDAQALPSWQLRKLELYTFSPSLPEELFDLAQRLAWQGKRAWKEQQKERPLGLCSDPRSYALGARRTATSFELEITMEP